MEEREMQHMMSRQPSCIYAAGIDACDVDVDDNGEEEEVFRYTSLKDILPQYNSPRQYVLGGYGSVTTGHTPGALVDVHEFHSSAISLRNQLLKHAASAYLQSAVLANRNQALDRELWRRPSTTSGLGCVFGPVECCLAFIARSVSNVLACLAGRVADACAGGRRMALNWEVPQANSIVIN